MICGHCQTTIAETLSVLPIGLDDDGRWLVASNNCPACGKLLVFLVQEPIQTGMRGSSYPVRVISRTPIRPMGTPRPPCSDSVPADIAEDYNEASIVLPHSAKASAALSRRCLQNLISEYFQIKERDLATQISKLLEKKILPSHLADNVDAIRNIGNFAAHPLKCTSTGEILPVEKEEAAWNLDVLEQLFDFSYVQPAKNLALREKLNKKLETAGKPPMK